MLETGSFSSGNTVNKYRNTQIRDIRKLGDKAATTKNEDALIWFVTDCLSSVFILFGNLVDCLECF